MVLTREYLANYVYLDSQIKRMRRRLKYFETHPLLAEHGVVSGSMRSFPYAQCHFVVAGSNIKSDEERKKKISQLLVDLNGNKRLYEDMKLDIEYEIEKITDLEIKTILQRKYIDRVSDGRIGRELGYDRSTISKKIDKYLDSIKLQADDKEISSALYQLSHNSQS